MNNLKDLYLDLMDDDRTSYNEFGNIGLKALSEALENKINLANLYLNFSRAGTGGNSRRDSTKINEAGGMAFCNVFRTLTKLQSIWISFRGNLTYNNTVKSLIENLTNLDKLEDIDIDVGYCNFISDDCITAVYNFFISKTTRKLRHFSMNFHFGKLTDMSVINISELCSNKLFDDLSTILFDFTLNDFTEDGKLSIITAKTAIDKALAVFITGHM